MWICTVLSAVQQKGHWAWGAKAPGSRHSPAPQNVILILSASVSSSIKWELPTSWDFRQHEFRQCVGKYFCDLKVLSQWEKCAKSCHFSERRYWPIFLLKTGRHRAEGVNPRPQMRRCSGVEVTRKVMSPEACSDQSDFLIAHLCSLCCCKLFGWPGPLFIHLFTNCVLLFNF